MTSFAVRSFGCRVNQAEAFGWVEELRRRGLRLEKDAGRGDLLVVNTCTLTARADRDVRRFLLPAARENPGASIVVTGCSTVRGAGELRRMPGVRLIVPNAEKEGLAERVLAIAGAGMEDGAGALESEDGAGVPFRARAFLKVQDGCDHRCAYCIIPSVRGRSASVPAETVIGRLRALVAGGYREAVLAGIHLGSYGRDLEPRNSLAALLDKVEAVDGLGRIRLSSLDPRSLDDALLARLAAGARIAPHFHLSLQSGSERTLRAMGRTSGPRSYDSLLAELGRRVPDAGLGADIIVGFPGESDGDFEMTRAFVERSPLSYVHVFPFSPRRGTPAADMEPVDSAIKTRRADALRRLSREKDLAFRKRYIGRVLEAVVISRKNGTGVGVKGSPDGEDSAIRRENAGDGTEEALAAAGCAEVLTGNGFSVSVPACRPARREMVSVRITDVRPDATSGIIL